MFWLAPGLGMRFIALEYLVSRGSLEVDVSYGGVGRPERIYRMNR